MTILAADAWRAALLCDDEKGPQDLRAFSLEHRSFFFKPQRCSIALF
jgi:hypothetical protein